MLFKLCFVVLHKLQITATYIIDYQVCSNKPAEYKNYCNSKLEFICNLKNSFSIAHNPDTSCNWHNLKIILVIQIHVQLTLLTFNDLIFHIPTVRTV